MGAIAVFDYNAWIGRYPEFTATVNSVAATALFAEATLYHANDGTGPVIDPNGQLALLNMLTAHVAQLYYGSSQQGVSALVGQAISASEGSVSVGVAQVAPAAGSKEWYMQTKYGASYWAAIAPFKMGGYYTKGPRRTMNPWNIGPYLPR